MTTDDPTNILIVDDLAEKLLVYRTILDDPGQNLVTARSGEDALRAVLNQDFAVILLDVNMPGMSGLETAALIRRRRRSAHTPIIFVTAFADEVRAAEGYATGAVDYITTPVVPSVLKAKVRVFADLYRMTQQVKRQAEERVALTEERARREAAEDANRRLEVLAKAGAVLGQSLDREVTARDVVRLALPVLADEAVLVAARPDGGPGPAVRAAAGADGPAVGEAAVPGGELGAALAAALAGQETPADGGAVVALPLRTGGRVFAALGLSRGPSGRAFTPADRTVAVAYASRAGIALENARLYHEVQLADRQKNEFLSMLAHELRNPLAPIRNANEVLRHLGADPVRVKWAQGVIDRQLAQMVRLVDDLLDVSRLTLGKIRLVVEPVDLRAVVAQAVESARPLIDQFRHHLDVDVTPDPAPVTGDRARLAQVFTNLLNNAAKYTNPGGRITLGVELGNGPAPHAEVRVTDTGIGIPADVLPTVFELFTQANRSLDRSQGGLGVGLTLVRRLVEMHGGAVEASSPGPGAGSEFVVRLPLARPDPAAPPPAPAPAAAAGGPAPVRVLVVDDNVDGAESLAGLLQLMGHAVRVAHDGPAGLAAAREFRPDLVLLDIGLPGMDGYEVGRHLAAEFGDRPVRAALSGYGREDDVRRSREAGLAAHLVKPVDLAQLRGLLDRVRAARG